jgi:bacterioferritin (cytochrome b1)
MVDYVKYCREAADDTFYDPLKESWNMVGDHIEKLETALRDLSDGYECCPVSQAMRRVARKALEGKDD